MQLSEGGGDLCAFCRTPKAAPGKEIKRTKELMERGNGNAFHHLGGLYAQGECGLPLDH